ncbi:hypothetical protein ABZY44_21780 [Streptomyces sp. NPDC006544]|uniref:hypothetical protein n=1 Tax=Streptomyces sp. NPDC006544 TaxID=3154583 RepID=UPI0033B0781E
MTRDLDRLAKAVKARRLELYPSRLAAAAAAGISKDTWQRVEDGKPVRDGTYAKMESILRWAAGSSESITAGESPVEVLSGPAADDTSISRVPTEWLEGEFREAVQSAAIATTSNLTVREIRELNEEVMNELRRRGILPKAS